MLIQKARRAFFDILLVAAVLKELAKTAVLIESDN